MITHPFFMFCLIMFLGNLGACKCLDYQGLSCILARARLNRNLALFIIHGERVIYTGQFDRSFVPWISVTEQRECTIHFRKIIPKNLDTFLEYSFGWKNFPKWVFLRNSGKSSLAFLCLQISIRRLNDCSEDKIVKRYYQIEASFFKN